MSKLFMVLVLAVVMGFGAMSVDSSDIKSDIFPRCDYGWCGPDNPGPPGS